MAEFASLSYEELLGEIEREEGILSDLEARLTELQKAEAEAKEHVVRERDPRLWERRKARAETIYALELDVAERSDRISRLTTRIAELEAYAARPDIAAVERYITRRTISILRRTVGALRGWQTRKERTLRSLKGWQTRELALEPRLKELYEALAYWTREITLLTTTITTEQDRLERKKEELGKREKFVADEECSGYNIYYNPETKKYLIRDPDTKELIRTEDKICMEITASIKTRIGHDVPVVVEITCTTYVKEMGLSDLIGAERKVHKGLEEWLIEQAWGALIHAFEKIGVAYNGENHVKEKVWYTWEVPDYTKVHVIVEKKKPRPRSYHGDFEVEG